MTYIHFKTLVRQSASYYLDVKDNTTLNYMRTTDPRWVCYGILGQRVWLGPDVVFDTNICSPGKRQHMYLDWWHTQKNEFFMAFYIFCPKYANDNVEGTNLSMISTTMLHNLYSRIIWAVESIDAYHVRVIALINIKLSGHVICLYCGMITACSLERV